VQIVRDWFRRYANDPQVVVLTLLLAAGFLTIFVFGGMLVPVLASMVIAYLLDGVILFLRRWRLPRKVSVPLVYFAFLTLFVFVLLAVVPIISRQATQAISELPSMIDKLKVGLQDLPQRYEFIDEEQFNTFLASMGQKLQEDTAQLGGRFVEFSITSVQGMIVLFVYMILMPILVFFMLKDKHRILEWFKRFVPKERRLAAEVWHDVDRQIGNYVRGKFWEICIVGGATQVTFTLLDLNYRTLLALLVGFSVVVPYVGATVVTFPVAFVAYAQWGFTSDFVWVVVAYLIIQALDGNVLVPLLFSEVVSLHPIAIIAAVLVFGGVWGFWGVFFAIPLATLVQSVIKAWPRKSRERPGKRLGDTQVLEAAEKR
jgi:putative permease